MDYTLVLLIVAIVEGIIILKCLLELSKQIESGLDELDSNLAGAIQQVVENFTKNIGLGENFEAPNPIQQVIAGFIQNIIYEGDATSLPRSSDGKFAKQD